MSYPQPEGNLGEVLVSNGKDLGYDSGLGQACIETGEAFQQLSESKYSLEDSVKQNFLEPLTQLQSKDLKEIAHHRKKLAGRRLDYDCKKRKREKGGAVPDEELSMAEEKFEESKELAETAMFNLLSNDVEQISQVKAFVDSCLEYHKNAVEILSALQEGLNDKCRDASSKPRAQHVPKRVASVASNRSHQDPFDGPDSNGKTSSYNMGGGGSEYATVSKPAATAKSASARALYDFDPENEGELGFSEGDMIELTQKIDENWFEGKVRGQIGFFPINYVEVVNPL